mmetsp:Transcript_33410/g.92293  ORF Transcript_33410/g.92293 Transcript_33410/m.92293 type:complete len:476 (+) Transcript_33410:314-1741(+)
MSFTTTFSGKVPRPDPEPFDSFLSLRPARKTPTAREATESLAQEVLRAKRHMLEAAIQSELRVVDDPSAMDVTARGNHLGLAQQYLQHPERIETAFSDAGSEEDNEDEAPLPEGWETATGSNGRRYYFNRSTKESQFQRPPDAEEEEEDDMTEIMQRSASLPTVLSFNATALLSASAEGKPLAFLPPLPAPSPTLQRKKKPLLIDTQAPIEIDVACSCGNLFLDDSLFCRKCGAPKPAVNLMSPPAATKDVPVLSRFWQETRLWNIKIFNKGSCARRNTLEIPGGAVVLGNGRIKNHEGNHVLNPGYFFSFEVKGIDDENYPLKPDSDGSYVKDMSFGFGVSRLPPTDQSCIRPQYGYEIPGAVLVGYGPNVIDKQWMKPSGGWSTKDLKENDEVGLLVTFDGDVIIYVNREQVLRFESSFAEDMLEYNGKRNLWPVIDLHGRVYSVKLLPRKVSPNLPIHERNTLTLNMPWNKE